MAADASHLPAIMTLLAAVVAGGIARSSLIVSKETKISEFRQAWINLLREELADLFSSSRSFIRAVQESREDNSNDQQFSFSRETVTKMRHSVAESYYKIQLRLNPDQSDHKILLGLIRSMMSEIQTYVSNPDDSSDGPIKRIDEAAYQAAKILKSEWGTVKNGETAYRRALKLTGAILIIGVGLLVTLLWREYAG